MIDYSLKKNLVCNVDETLNQFDNDIFLKEEDAKAFLSCCDSKIESLISHRKDEDKGLIFIGSEMFNMISLINRDRNNQIIEKAQNLIERIGKIKMDPFFYMLMKSVLILMIYDEDPEKIDHEKLYEVKKFFIDYINQ